MLPQITLPKVNTGPFYFGGEAAAQMAQPAPNHWRDWLRALFPRTFTLPFADHHIEYWQWLESIEAGTKPDVPAFASILARGGGKTTNAETGVIRLGARRARQFVLYVRATQDKANESIQNIAAKLESNAVERHYPALASRKLGKYGYSKGWRMDLFRCQSGFSGMALGLDAAARGVKLEDVRPDLIVFDDVDSIGDSPKTIQKKIDIITKSILPAGAPHLTVLVIQNVMHATGIVNSIVEGTAEFLYDCHVSGPHPAVHNLTYEQREDGRGYRVTGGEPTWKGQDLAVCEQQINEWGLTAFLNEAQHDVEESGGVWDHVEFRHCAWDDVPDLVRGCVWVDPAVTATDQSDSHGIQADGIAPDGDIYRLYSWEAVTSPEDSLARALLKAVELGFDTVGVESDQGGDAWQSVYMRAWDRLVESRDHPQITKQTRRPHFKQAKAGAGHGPKAHRNSLMLADYERGKIVHVRGTHGVLERALRRFPKKPLDLADVAYWSWADLRDRAKPQEKPPASHSMRTF